MWMAEVPLVPFTWQDGMTYSIRDIKVVPSYEDVVEISLSQNDKLDEVASRMEIYGQDAEDLTYLLFEANIVQVTENNFDLNKIHKLRIPATT